jgi:hypothetical protein
LCARYIYDTFKYEHCSSMGLEIGAAVSDDDDAIAGTPPKGAAPASGSVF